MTDTDELWRGDFGDDYTKRQGATLKARRGLWMAATQFITGRVESVLEVGANRGDNLKALMVDRSDIALYATEPNARARKACQKLIGRDNVTSDTSDALSFKDNSIDLVVSCGVLIHVAPDRLSKSLTEIHRVARKFIMCAEYFAPSEEMIPYRGNDHAMWRRDYGSLYLEAFPDLECLGCGFMWKPMTGLDNLTIWLFEKPGTATLEMLPPSYTLN